ncbi:MAG TPA: hypothetical protein VFE14_02975 [Micromonosporaceae bacterium]|nr:hypothetical protein [Micromonosporaceae bacterium]
MAGLIGLAGVVALAGCGRVADTATDRAAGTTVEVAEALGPEAAALAAMGFDPAEFGAVAEAAAPVPSASPGSKVDKLRPGRHKLRVFLRRNVLHGEAVVQTKDGTVTLVVQRGTVTAIDGTTVTVKSTDGFTLTWTFGDPIHVIEHRTTIQPNQIAVGTEIGVAGAKDGGRTLARLILVPGK